MSNAQWGQSSRNIHPSAWSRGSPPTSMVGPIGARSAYGMPTNIPFTNRVNDAMTVGHPGARLRMTGNGGDLRPALPRSMLLEEYRSGRRPNLELGNVMSCIIEFARDQHGSRFIQQKLERASPKEKQAVFCEIEGRLPGLMTDVFGNYVIQKFFEFGTPEQREHLYEKLKGNVLTLAMQMYGCRVIQKALEQLSECLDKDLSPEDATLVQRLRETYQLPLIRELEGNVVRCVKDQNGNHVIQKIIKTVKPENIQFIVDAFKGEIYNLSIHLYGCRVIQRALERCSETQKRAILDELLKQTKALVLDQYGNYVIQHVLEHGEAGDKQKVVDLIKEELLAFSQHKFASNVVERCFSNGTVEQKRSLINQVLYYSSNVHDSNNYLFIIMKDPFMNYVVQKMLDSADQAQRWKLMVKIKPHAVMLHKYTYGKPMTSKLETFSQKNNNHNTEDRSYESDHAFGDLNWINKLEYLNSKINFTSQFVEGDRAYYFWDRPEIENEEVKYYNVTVNSKDMSTKNKDSWKTQTHHEYYSSNIEENKRYRIVVTAYNKYGDKLAEGKSKQLSKAMMGEIIFIKQELEGFTMSFEWKPFANAKGYHSTVFKKTKKDWQRIDHFVPSKPQCSIRDIKMSVDYKFVVKAVDKANIPVAEGKILWTGFERNNEQIDFGRRQHEIMDTIAQRPPQH